MSMFNKLLDSQWEDLASVKRPYPRQAAGICPDLIPNKDSVKSKKKSIQAKQSFWNRDNWKSVTILVIFLMFSCLTAYPPCQLGNSVYVV